MISRGIPSAKDPQWGCFEQDQAEALQRYGHKVVVASVDSRFLKRWRKIGITHKHKDGVDYYNSFWVPGAITNLISQSFGLFIKEKQLDRIYRKIEATHGKPDVIYSHYLPYSYSALKIKQKYDLPLVAIEHWSEVNKEEIASKVQYMGSRVYNTADKVISVSGSLRNMIKRHFAVDSVVVHNLVGKEFGYIAPQKNKEYFDFVSVGSLFYIKGYDILIEAFAKLQLAEKVRLTIVGMGDQYEYLSSLVDKYNLQEKVFLVGRKNKNEIVDILANSDVYVSSSRSENFSVSILEALAIGLPVVATICGGIKECINQTNGLLVSVENPNELSVAMLQMHQNYKDYDRLAISEDCKRRFSPSVIAKQLTEIFDDVVDSRRKTN